MLVGINHPWVSCGHDFGPRPPAWGGAHARRDWDAAEAELRSWAEVGIRVSRFWVLAGGVNYPAGEDPYERYEVADMDLREGPLRRALRDRLVVQRFGERWRRFSLGAMSPPDALPPLPQAYLDDFRALLRACRAAGVKLMPTLVSFEFFHPIDIQKGGVASRGRAALVFGESAFRGGRADPRQVERFLDVTLTPLLEVSQEFPDAIYAWDVANEPDWVVRGGPIHARLRGRRLSIMPKTVPAAAMTHFLARALDRIGEAGFVGSVGFKRGDPGWLPAGSMARLAALGKEGRYVHQLHHYPSPYEPWLLPDHDAVPIRPCIVGEFPTSQAKPLGVHAWCWPEGLAHYRAELDPERYLEARLRLIERKGYAGALLWGGRSTDGMSAWGPPQHEQVRRYCDGARLA